MNEKPIVVRNYRSMTSWEIIEAVNAMVERDMNQKQMSAALGCHQAMFKRMVRKACARLRIPPLDILSKSNRKPVRKVAPYGVVCPLVLIKRIADVGQFVVFSREKIGDEDVVVCRRSKRESTLSQDEESKNTTA